MAAIETKPSGGGPNSVPGDGYRYDTVTVTSGNLELVQKQVFDIYRNFRKNPFTAVDRIRDRINVSDEDANTRYVKVEFAINPSGRRVGFVAYSLKDVLVDGQELLVVDLASKVIEPKYQKDGIGTRFTRDIVEKETPDAYTGLTANPFAYVANLNTGHFEEVDEETEYSGFVQRAMTRTLGKRVVQVTDLRCGLCVDVFPHEEGIQRFDINPDEHPLAYRVYMAWLNLGLDPNRYDGKRYWLTVDRSKVPPKELPTAA